MADGDRVSPRALIEDWLQSTTEKRAYSKREHKVGQKDEAQRHRRQHREAASTAVSNTVDSNGAHLTTTRYKDDSVHRKRTREMRPSDVKDHIHPPLDSPSLRRDEDHFRSNPEKVLGLTHDSCLEPPPSVELRSLKRRIGHGHTTDTRNWTRKRGNVGQSDSSDGAPSAIQLHDTQPAPGLYERRPRRKTHEDRYKPRPDTKMKRRLATNAKKVTSAPRDRKQKRREKSGATVMHRFEAQNISQDRVTLKPLNKLGIFGNGRASSPVRRRPLPDLAFSELDFLNSRRSKVQDEDEKKRQRFITKTAREDSEMSKYFKSTPKAPETSAKRKAESHQERRPRCRSNIQSDLGMDGGRREFLGFGSRGPKSSVKTLDEIRTPSLKMKPLRQAQSPTPSNSYFSWSQSAQSQRINGSAKVVREESHIYMRDGSLPQNPSQQKPVGSVSPKERHRVDTLPTFSTKVRIQDESDVNFVTNSDAYAADDHHPPLSQPDIVVSDVLGDNQDGRVNQNNNPFDVAEGPQSTATYKNAGQQTTLEEHSHLEPKHHQPKVIHPELQPSNAGANALEANTATRQPDLAEEPVDEIESLLRLCKALTPTKKDKALHVLLRDQTAMTRERQDLHSQDGGHGLPNLTEISLSKSCEDTDEARQRPVSQKDDVADRKICQTRMVHRPEATSHIASGNLSQSAPHLSGSHSRGSAQPSFAQLQRTGSVNMVAVNGYSDIYTRQLIRDRHRSLTNEQERRYRQDIYESEEHRLDSQKIVDHHHFKHRRSFDDLDDTERPVLRTVSSYFSDQHSVSRSNLRGTPYHDSYSSPNAEYQISDHFRTMPADEDARTESLVGLQQPELAFDRSAEHSRLIEMSPSMPYKGNSGGHVPHKLSNYHFSGRDFGGEDPIASRQASRSDRPQLQNFWTPNRLY